MDGNEEYIQKQGDMTLCMLLKESWEMTLLEIRGEYKIWILLMFTYCGGD